MDWLYQILTYLAVALGDPAVPATGNELWSKLDEWKEVGGYFETTSTSKTLAEVCRANPESLVVTPVIIQGFHTFYGDGQMIHTSRQHRAYGSSMNNSAAISCNQFQKYSSIEWRVRTNTRSYAQLSSFPELHERLPLAYTLTNFIPIATAAILFVLGITIYALFSATAVGRRINLPFLASNLLAAAHFALTVPEALGLEIPEFYLHRMHDIVLEGSVALLGYVFLLTGACPKRLQRIHVGIVCFSIAISLAARDLSQSQVGSTIAFLGNWIVFSGLAPVALLRAVRSRGAPKKIYQFLALACFSIAIFADQGTHLGWWSLPPLYGIAFLGPLVFTALSINDEIVSTYRERDSLRHGLELKVEEKTRELSAQSKSLELAYNDLRNLKADAIQSARLAALGTLSAGIAHEINNSLNYVNGSLTPLRSLITKASLSETEQKKATFLFRLMDEGLALTFDIIKNLKNQAGTGNGELEDVALKGVVDGTLLLLKNKIPATVEVRVAIDPAVKVRANQTGVTQVATNLIGNAIDALVESKTAKGTIDVIASVVGGAVEISFRDNGPGIPDRVLDRIFEPFFTTKAEGKGTGLGLHLVRSELEKMQGSIRVLTQIGVGTEFVVTLRQPDAKASDRRIA